MTISTYLGNAKLKRSGVQLDFTKDQVEEFIKCKNDITYFANNYMKIVHVDHGLIQMKFFGYQEEVIKIFDSNRWTALLQCRQSGKCVEDKTIINIRNKSTGKIQKIEIGELYEQQKAGNQISNQET